MAAAVKRNTSSDYDGPTPKEMIANHTLAQNIIDRHMDSCPIFDDRSILLLREFVHDPSSARAILERLQLLDDEGDKTGTKATAAGDLAALIVARHGGDSEALTGGEIEKLREWFDNGGGRTDDELSAA